MGLTQEDLTGLFNPWLLRAAWSKVARWYQQGEWYDVAEFMAWQARPSERLAHLATRLAHGEYLPRRPFPLIPYPKKGDRTRHFAVPSVEDQAAFMTFLVLLGPFLEARMPNVSFGNRIFRPRVLAKSSNARGPVHKRWYRGPFSLTSPSVYESFSTSYGLFRRLLQWIVNDAVLGHEHGPTNRDTEFEDADLLPYLDFLRNEPHARGTDLAYARLDVTLAYPSVNRKAVCERMAQLILSDAPTYDTKKHWGRPDFKTLLSKTDGPFINILEAQRPFAGAHPWHILKQNEELRAEICHMFSESIMAIQYGLWEEPQGWNGEDLANPKAFVIEGNAKDSHGIWPPNCSIPSADLETSRYGLPTGLAASGLLLNVALTPIDLEMCREYDKATAQGKPQVAYLRYVDDIVLISPDVAALERSILVLKEKLSPLGLRFGADKAKPKSVREFIEGRSATMKLSNAEYLGRASVSFFTTEVVREMSGLDDATLDEAFGSPGLRRLEELLGLAAREDDDWEVGADARLSFAVNKMARTFWPTNAIRTEVGVVQPSELLARILLTAETAIRRHPWRFKLWKALLIIALRASTTNSGRKLAEQWLSQNILPLIRWDGPKPRGQVSKWSWEELDEPITSGEGLPAEQAATLAQRRYEHRRLRTCRYGKLSITAIMQSCSLCKGREHKSCRP